MLASHTWANLPLLTNSSFPLGILGGWPSASLAELLNSGVPSGGLCILPIIPYALIHGVQGLGDLPGSFDAV